MTASPTLVVNANLCNKTNEIYTRYICILGLVDAQKSVCGWGSAPDPAKGAYSASPDFLAGGPFPKNPRPAFSL